MMDRWEQLEQKERQLSSKLDEIWERRVALEVIYSEFEWYDSYSRAKDFEAWEGEYKSRYNILLEEQRQLGQQVKQAPHEEFDEVIAHLKKEEAQLENERDAVYYEKRLEYYKEKEKYHGN